MHVLVDIWRGACYKFVVVVSLSPVMSLLIVDSLAEWSKALAQGASPHGRGLEPHSCQLHGGGAPQAFLPGNQQRNSSV